MERRFLETHGFALRCGLLAVVGAVVAWLLFHPLLGGPGMTWDEAYYYRPFLAARHWLGLFLTSPGTALSSEALYAGWEPIHELPPVVKWIGVACLSFGGEGWWKVAMLRIYPAVFFGLSLAMILVLGRRLTGFERCGWFAVLVYALHPRLVGHAAYAATETVFGAVNLMVILAATGPLHSWRGRVFLVVALGLAVATKVNGLILIVTVLFWLLTRRIFDRSLGKRGDSVSMKSDLILSGGILVFSPLLAFLIWPWLWDQTGARLYGYYIFIREHFLQGVWYFGERWNFNGPPAPATYPFVITHLTTPVVLLLVGWIGILAGVARLVMTYRLPHRSYLVALSMLAPFVASSLPSAPKYDGIRLFFPMFAPAAILAAVGCHWLLIALQKRGVMTRRKVPLVYTATMIMMVLLAFPTKRPSNDYYNLPTRLYGAQQSIFPFEQTYWGNGITPAAVREMNDIMAPGSKVITRAIHPLIFELHQEWGLLSEAIQFNPEPPYNYHLIHTRRGFWGNADWTIYTTREPLATWGEGADGEPLLYLYDGRPPGQ